MILKKGDLFEDGAPDTIRTCDRWYRKLLIFLFLNSLKPYFMYFKHYSTFILILKML